MFFKKPKPTPISMTFCIDHPVQSKPDPKDGHIAGWCICSHEIIALQFQVPTGIVSAHYGASRPDIHKLYPDSPTGRHCGFSFEMPSDFLTLFNQVNCIVTLREGIIQTKIFIAPVKLHTNVIQDTTLYPVENVKQLLPQSDDIEQHLKSYLKKNPSLTLRLDLINKCNLRCIMCHCSSEKYNKQPLRLVDPESFKRDFSPLAPLTRDVMLSCAFEPLLSKHFPDIVNLLSQQGGNFRFGMCTNVMLLNSQNRRLLLEAGMVYVLFSLDGVTKKTAESIRQNASFERIIANLKAFHLLKQKHNAFYPMITMDFVMMNCNIHEAPAFVRMCSQLGVRSIDFRHVVPSQFYNITEEQLCNHPEKYNYFYPLILREGQKLGIELVLPKPFDQTKAWTEPKFPDVTLDDFDAVEPDPAEPGVTHAKKFPDTYNPVHHPGFAFALFPGIACHHPFAEVMINTQGYVFPCPNYPKPLGLLTPKKNLRDIFFDKPFQRLREQMFQPGGDPHCRNCPVQKKYFGKTRTDAG